MKYCRMRQMNVDFNKYLKATAAILTAMIFCLSIGFSTKTFAAGDKRVVKIPYGINDYLRIDEKGNLTGYCSDYLKRLAEINNWEYEYVEASWTEAVNMLDSGEIDLLFPTNYTPERENTMEFPSILGGYTAAGLFARSDSSYSYEDFQSFNGAKIAVTKGSSNDYSLIDFAEAKGFDYTAVYVETNDDKIEALQNGTVDMVTFSAANDVPNGMLVSLLDPSPFYYTVKKGNNNLLNELEYGMQKIMTGAPELMSETYVACLLGKNTIIQAYTEEERDFINSREEIVIGFYKEAEPLAYIREDGTYGGIYPDLIEYVKQTSGFNIRLQPFDRENDWKKLLEDGEIDFYIGASAPIATFLPTLNATDAFLDYMSILVTRNDCKFNQIETPTIALTYARSYWVYYLPEEFGEVETKYYRNTKDCLIAVQSGEADGAILNNYEFNYQSKNTRFATVITWENYRFNTRGGLVTSADSNPAMLTAMNKALSCLTPSYVDSVVSSNLNMPYKSTISDTLYISRYPLIAIGIVALAIIGVILVILIVRTRQKRVLDIAKEHERNQLKILAALSHDYEAIYYTDLDNDTCQMVRIVDNPTGPVPDSTIHSEAMKMYIESSVMPEYRDILLKFADPKEIINQFEQEKDFAVRYKVIPNEKQKDFFEMHFVNASVNRSENFMVFGVRCVDEAAKDEQKQKQLLQDALQAANRANSAKSEFLSKMSHDIRTPMNAIIGMTAIAGAYINDPERIQDALKKISSASRHLLGLINEVLDMSKIESGRISLNEEEFNLSELLNNLIVLIQPQIEEHNHTLDVQIRDIKHEDVIGDSLRIQQVFLNIMGNAVKYTENGGKLSLLVQEKPTSTQKAARYEFIFKDNGIGMTKEFLEHIFEPFTRAEDLRISKIQGTGLGMPIANNIVQMMNGSIEVQSELGKGSEFTVTIFLKTQDKSDMDTSELAGLPVLVVDDDADTCDLVCELLNEIGMIGEGQTSGEAAVEAVKRTMNTSDRFYAAILDWKMPGMDGIETARAIRKLTNDEMPIIILSSYDYTEVEQEAREAGVDEFLCKPIFKSGLIRMFKALKSGSNAEDHNDSELKQIEESDYSTRRVLLVEDNDLNREIAKEIFEMAGLQVEEAENGKIAVEMFTAAEIDYYDLIFMDIQMPVMNGYEATKAIRTLDRADSQRVPIVAMTANAFVEDIQAVKAAGLNEHLAKPIDFDRLGEVLKKYL